MLVVLQIRIPFVRQRSDPTLETNMLVHCLIWEPEPVLCLQWQNVPESPYECEDSLVSSGLLFV